MKENHSALPWQIARDPAGPWPYVYNHFISPNIVSWCCVVVTNNGVHIECRGKTEAEATANADLVVRGVNQIKDLCEQLLLLEEAKELIDNFGTTGADNSEVMRRAERWIAKYYATFDPEIQTNIDPNDPNP